MQTMTAAKSPVAIALEETLLWLCSIPSPIGEEGPLCDAVQARMDRLKLASPIRRYNNSIVVPLTRRGRKHIALVGHLDTVRTENGPARADGGRIYGAGASDMKSGLALMIVLAETIADIAGPDLTLVFYAKEEGPYKDNELGPVLEQDPDLAKVDLAVALEPSDNRLHLGCCGSLHATVTFEGRTAHSARPWEGENAITKAATFLDRLAVLQPEEHVVDGLVYKSVFTVTQANDGGRGRNIVPDRFSLNVNHRFPPGVTPEKAQANLVGLVGAGARVEFTDVSPSAMPAASHPFVKELVPLARSVEPKQAWTDVARFAALGIPAINFGPGENAQAHQKNESTDAALVFQGYKIFYSWLTQLKL